MYANKDEILEWAKNNNIKTKTQNFLTENDKLIAYLYYYYFILQKQKKKKK